MANTYELISSNVLTSTTASVTFSSIPATYTDLALRFTCRGSANALVDWLYARFNGVSSAQYSTTTLENQFGSALTQLFANASQMYLGQCPLNTYTSNIFGTGELYIPSYTSSQNKAASSSYVLEQTSASADIQASAALWSNTAAITSVTLLPAQGSFVAGSSFYLYGIKNS